MSDLVSTPVSAEEPTAATYADLHDFVADTRQYSRHDVHRRRRYVADLRQRRDNQR